MQAGHFQLHINAGRAQGIRYLGHLVALICLLTSLSSASTIVGTVVDRSTGQPSAGDEVVLYRVDQTMHEEARAKSDNQGQFRFNTQADARYLIAAVHQAVSYHTAVVTGTAAVEVSVYDAAAALNEVREESDTMFFETEADTLRVTEFYVLNNQSNPPRTLSTNNTFDFALPRQAVLDSVAVQPPKTLPVRISASRRGLGRHYGVAYPLRPGVSRIRVVYHLPYSGKAFLAPALSRPVAAMALMVPESMLMESKIPGAFSFRGKHDGLAVYVATNLRPGASLSFGLSGRTRTTAANDEVISLARSLTFPGTRNPTAPPHSQVSIPLNPQLAPVSRRNRLLGGACLAAVLTIVLGLMGALRIARRALALGA